MEALRYGANGGVGDEGGNLRAEKIEVKPQVVGSNEAEEANCEVKTEKDLAAIRPEPSG